eukprot:11069019-Alexandrium_andersonii.AAC.1
MKKVSGMSKRKIHLRTAPAYSSQSQGAIERYSRALADETRVLVADAAKRFGVDIQTGDRLAAWLVRHANWLLHRYRTHKDGRASYYKLHGTDNAGKHAPF